MSRYNRTNFYPKVTIKDSSGKDVIINEFGNSYYNRFFEIKRPLSRYTVKQEDIQRPEMISYKLYGTMDYWWILMRYNQIFDVFNDMYAGQVLNVPDTLDMDDFIINSSKAEK